MTLRYIAIAIGITVSLFTNVANGQSDFKSEEDLKKKAAELFEAKQFIEAAPLYAQLLSLYPKEPEYNFKYGASILYADADKSKALKYLSFATSKSSVDPRAYYYAGKGYHLNYQFTKALKNYNRFKSKASAAERNEYEIDQQIAMVKNGNDLLQSINGLDVISKESVAKEDFFRIYQLEGLDGKIVVKPDEFKSKYDRKNDESSIMFLPNNASTVYFSSYGKNGDNGRDIFKAVKLGNGKWSEAVSVGNSINTPYDEAFAFILPDGRTMYFASKGHNSIGGYDLFKSTYDQTIANWTEPVNLNFPFSTVNDDVMFVTNTEQSIAYFASDRNNSNDQYYVYKVGTTPKKPDLFVIKGKFTAESLPDLKRAKITVIDQATNETVGVYTTDNNGNYAIEVGQKGGNYKFNIETTEDAPIHAGIVSVPKQNEFVVLGQELRLVGEGESQKLVIKNIFDGSVNLADYGGGPIVSSEMLARKANMAQNIDEAELLADLRNTSAPADATATAKNEEVRSEEVKKTQTSDRRKMEEASLKAELRAISTVVQESQVDASKSAALAYADGYQKSNEALSFFKEAEKQIEIADSNIGTVKELALKKSKEAQNRGEQSALAAKLSLSYAEEFAQVADRLASQSATIASKEEAIAQKIESGDYAKASSDIALLKQELALQQDEPLLSAEKSTIADKNVALSQEIAAAENANASIKEQLNLLKNERATLNENLSSTKNKREVSKIQGRLSALNLDIEDLSFEVDKNNQAIADKQIERKNLEFEEMHLSSLENRLSSSQASITDIPSDQKESLKENVNYFDSNDLYFEPAKELDLAKPTIDSATLEKQLAELSTDAEFESRIQDVSSLLVASEMNLQLAEINQDWSNTIAERIRLKEALLDVANGQSDVSLIAEIEALNDQKAKKLNDFKKYQKLAYAQQDDSPKIDLDESSEPSYAQGYRLDLKQSEAISDEQSKIESQIAIYEDWNASIASDMNVLMGRVAAEGSTDMLSNQLATLKKQKATNDEALDDLALKTEQLAVQSTDLPSRTDLPDAIKPELNATINEDNNDRSMSTGVNVGTTEDETVESGTTTTKPAVIDLDESGSATVVTNLTASNLNTGSNIDYSAPVGTEEDDFSDLKYASDITYTSSSAKGLVEQATAEKAAARALLESYEEARKEALTYDSPEERTAAIQAADAMKEQAEQKQVNANKLYSDANKYQYVQQNATLNNIPKFTQQFQSKSLDLADLLVNESEYYLSEAQNIRASIKEGDRFTEKTEKLQKAYNFEVIALKKQQEAIVALSQARVEYENPSKVNVSPRKVASASVLTDAVNGQNALASRDAAQAEELRSEVAALNAEIVALQNELENTKKKEDRAIIEAEIITLTDKRDAKENKATILERRGEQLNKQLADLESGREARLEAIFSEKKERNKLRGATQLNQLGVDAGEVNLTEEEYNSVKSNPAYVTYERQIKERNRLIKEANVLYEEMEVARKEKNTSKVASLDKMIRIKHLLAQKKEQAAKESLANLSSSESLKMRKAGALASGMATASFELSDEIAAKSPSLRAEDIPMENGPNTVGSTQVDLGSLERNSETTAKITKERAKSTVAGSSLKASTKSTVTANLIFTPTKDGIYSEVPAEKSVYSKDNPIPIDVELPNGIIYKVQVGAFRNPISQDLFKGFAPLMGEKVSTGITRYTAGIFLNFAAADEAKKNIRALGYDDAFVVAFKDGKRINVAEARDAQIAGGKSPSPEEVKSMVRKLSSKEPTNPSGSIASERVSNPVANGLPIEFAEANVAPVKNISTIDGVYFTVQVGVYSKPISKGELDVPDLAVKVIKNKLYRYSSGVYDDAVKASIARDRIKKVVPDAFVIAYNNGVKISLEEALTLLNQ